MSHVNIWREVLNCDKPGSRMFIMDDHVVFYTRKKQETSKGLIEAFSRLWKAVPSDWDILYHKASAISTNKGHPRSLQYIQLQYRRAVNKTNLPFSIAKYVRAKAYIIE
jgi:hypothetical protein